MELQNKNIMIVGGLSHIGGALAFELEKNNEIIIPTTQQVNNTPFIIHNCDVTDYDSLKKVVVSEKPDIVIYVDSLPKQGFDTRIVLYHNFVSTLNVLHLCQETGLGCVMVTSYPELIELYSKVNVVLVNLCNVYGPGDVSPYNVMPKIFQTKIQKIKTNYKTEYEQWIFIKDVVKGFKELLINFEKAKGKTYDIMDSKLFSEKMISDILDGKKPIPKNNKKSYGFFNWKPEVSLEEGINQCLFWYKRVYQQK